MIDTVAQLKVAADAIVMLVCIIAVLVPMGFFLARRSITQACFVMMALGLMVFWIVNAARANGIEIDCKEYVTFERSEMTDGIRFTHVTITPFAVDNGTDSVCEETGLCLLGIYLKAGGNESHREHFVIIDNPADEWVPSRWRWLRYEELKELAQIDACCTRQYQDGGWSIEAADDSNVASITMSDDWIMTYEDNDDPIDPEEYGYSMGYTESAFAMND